MVLVDPNLADQVVRSQVDLIKLNRVVLHKEVNQVPVQIRAVLVAQNRMFKIVRLVLQVDQAAQKQASHLQATSLLEPHPKGASQHRQERNLLQSRMVLRLPPQNQLINRSPVRRSRISLNRTKPNQNLLRKRTNQKIPNSLQPSPVPELHGSKAALSGIQLRLIRLMETWMSRNNRLSVASRI